MGGEGWEGLLDLPTSDASAGEARPALARILAILLVRAILPELPFRWIPSKFPLAGSP